MKLISIGIGGPGCRAGIGPTGSILLVESDLADLAGLSARELAQAFGVRSGVVVEVDGACTAMRSPGRLFDLALLSEREVSHPLRPLWHAARKLLRETADTGIRVWVEQKLREQR